MHDTKTSEVKISEIKTPEIRVTEIRATETKMTVSVLLCAYTEERWTQLLAAIQSLQQQTRPADELILVIDHNPTLFLRAQQELADIRIIESSEKQGLSGARNSGLTIASGDIVAFMDEDAIAAPDWLERMLAHYSDPNVLGVGGAIEPLWHEGRPEWFPHEFDWVVGCTYWGMPLNLAPVRNLIGCNMSFRRSIFQEIGGFRDGIGRVGTRSVGCEETELCIRARQRWSHAEFLYDPNAHVLHRVPANRATWRYFLSRCYSEGISKALISRFVGATDALSSERTYTTQTLPSGVLKGVGAFLRGHVYGLGRAMAIVIGFLATLSGFLRGRLAQMLGQKCIANPACEPPAPGFKSAQMCEVELSEALPEISPVAVHHGYQRMLVLVRLHGQPLGMMELKAPTEGMSADDLALHIWRAYADEIQEHLRQDGQPLAERLSAAGIPPKTVVPCEEHYQTLLADAPFVSVVVATRDRAPSLALTLDSLLAMDYPNFEILVVDNKPATEATARLIRERSALHPNLRYVREEEAGLAVAHNRGVSEINAPLIAFTDDDVRVDRQWLSRIVQGFQASDNVGCVTGMILPAELQTPAQEWIEQYGGFSKGFERRIFDLKEHRPATVLHPYSAGIFGSGANMAFRSEALRAIGGFDPALGAGSKAMGGDDLAAFFDIISHGYRIVYEPAALLYHAHRRDYAGLRRQAYGYGVGLTAYLTKVVLDKPTRIFDFLLRMPQGVAHIFSATSPKNAKKQLGYPSELTRLERRGMLYGPIAYLRSRWYSRRRHRRDQWIIASQPNIRPNMAGSD